MVPSSREWFYHYDERATLEGTATRGEDRLGSLVHDEGVEMSAGGDLIKQSYDAFSRGDIPAVIETLSDDVRWDVPEMLPQGGSFSGRDGAGQFFQALGERYEDLGLDIHDLIDGDERVAGVGVARGKLRDGGDVEYGFVHVFDVSGGKVARFREYADRSLV
jgi:ketosteroid isomerase-like protein